MPSDEKTWVTAMLDAGIYDHEVNDIDLIETHISWVILTGSFVYKIKKPVDMGFLNFSTLAMRKYFCEQELILNQRLAAEYYVAVIPITGSYAHPQLNGKGEVVEYAVKMKQFPQDAQLDRLLAKGALPGESINKLADKIASFHELIPRSNEYSQFGGFAHIHEPVINCYREILKNIKNTDIQQRIAKLEQWTNMEAERLRAVFLKRKNAGYVRECHGDLHLRNIAIVKDEIIVFDGIEFSEDLRWNDVLSEIAFLVMDLDERGQKTYSQRFLNRYLELSGDYFGLPVLKYYLLYRAIVRAMVSSIRCFQKGIKKEEKEHEFNELINYIRLAESYTVVRPPVMFIMHGLSGSGKTSVSQKLLEVHPAIRVRSDIERKRIFNIHANERSDIETQNVLYSATASEKTYQRLYELAEMLIRAGFSVIVDATFQQQKYRKRFADLAQDLAVPFISVNCQASYQTLKQRIVSRAHANQDASDADLAVLEKQIQQLEPIDQVNEADVLLTINTEQLVSHNEIKELLEANGING